MLWLGKTYAYGTPKTINAKLNSLPSCLVTVEYECRDERSLEWHHPMSQIRCIIYVKYHSDFNDLGSEEVCKISH